MILLKKVPAIILVAICLLTSCRDKETATPSAINIQGPKAFRDTYGPPKQNFSFNTSELPKTIILKGGSRVIFPKYCFQQNSVHIDGAATVTVVEVLKRSDIIRSFTNTNYTFSNSLISQGFLKISAECNGAPVDVDLRSPMRIMIPADDNVDTTMLFPGSENTDSTGRFSWGVFDWDSTRVVAEGGYYSFDWRILGWVNCDIFYNVKEPKTSIKVTVQKNVGAFISEMGEKGNTLVLFCPKGYNSVIQLWGSGNDNTAKCGGVPIGIKGKVFALSILDDKYSMAVKEVTVKEGLEDEVTLSDATMDDVQAAIDALDGY